VLQQACERHGHQAAFHGLNTPDTRSIAVSLMADLRVTYARAVDSDQELLTGLATGGRVVDRQIRERPTARLEEVVIGPTASAPTP
jgi:hypothetical protein